jgi:hypothetical protein
MKIEIYCSRFVIRVPDGGPEDVNEWIEDQLANEPDGKLCSKLMLNIGWRKLASKKKRSTDATKEP